jgi:hypothetical protein
MRTLAAGTIGMAVWLAHYAYYVWPEATDERRWAHYVGNGFGFALLCALLIVFSWQWGGVGALTVGAGAWGAADGLMVGACGAASWMKPRALDMCIGLLGPWRYALISGVLLLWFMWILLPRKRK